jgi:para-aminobenzoate synthetase component 2
MNSAGRKILVVDNHDSFVFNIVQYLNEIGAITTVVTNSEIKAEFAKNFDGVLISPGPGTPEDAGVSVDVIKYCAVEKIPVLGICLGLQVIGIVFGAKVSGASELIHGRTSVIEHCGENIFKEIPNNFKATRYHSLALEENSIGGLIEITARSDDKTIMGIRIKDKDIYGVQFHPEAVLSEFGYELLANWLEICGDVGARKRINGMSPIASNS